MKPIQQFSKSLVFCVVTVAAIFVIAVKGLQWARKRETEAPRGSLAGVSAPAVASFAKPQIGTAAAEEVPLRPLPVAERSTTHEWTAGDGMDPKLIERIAHNPDEFVKMVEENARIKRRQLVYRNDTAAAVIQRARLSGEPVGRLTLPALDGKELDFEITRADLFPSGQGGTFTGRLAGRGSSLVTLAFQFGRESFTVVSPEDGLFLQAHPREPGEIIITSFDPDTYLPAGGGEDHIVRPSETPAK